MAHKRPAEIGDTVSLAPLHALMYELSLAEVAPPLRTHLDIMRTPPPATSRAGFLVLDALIARMDSLMSFQPPDENGLPMETTDGQFLFHHAFIGTVLELIFGEAGLEGAREELAARYGYAEIRPCASVLAGRRVGKSVAVALFVAAAMLELPRLTVVVASLRKRVSVLMMKSIQMYLKAVPGVAARIIASNSECVQLCSEGDPLDIREIKCVPGVVDNCRGVGADIVIIDEGAFLKSEFFRFYVCPTMQRRGAAFIIITTPNAGVAGGTNYVKELSALVDVGGRPVVTTVHIGGRCGPCRAEKRPSCPHSDIYMPSHLPTARRALARLLMTVGTDDDGAMAVAQELEGQFAEDGRGYVPTGDVAALRAAAVWAPRAEFRVPRVFIMADPTFGGASRMAICAAFYLPGARAFVLVGLAAEVAPDNESAGGFITRFVAAVRRTMRTHAEPRTEYVLIIEANNGAVASDRYRQFKEALMVNGVGSECVTPYQHLAPGGVPRVGVIKTEKSTYTMYNSLRDALVGRRIYVHHDMGRVTAGVSVKAAVGSLCDELARVRIVREIRMDAAGRRSDKYSLHGKAGGTNDDLAVVLGMTALFPLEWASRGRVDAS